MAGVNRQICTWPVIRLTLWYAEKPHTFEILKFDDLPFLILLERDALDFGTLIQAALREVMAVEEKLWEGEGDHDSTEEAEQMQAGWTINQCFLQDQKSDETLRCLWDNPVVSEETPIERHRPTRYPRIEIHQGLLWQVNAPSQPGPPNNSKWWCPKNGGTWCYARPTDIPGRTWTLTRVLERFFWPGVSQDVGHFVKACGPCQAASWRGRQEPPSAHCPL